MPGRRRSGFVGAEAGPGSGRAWPRSNWLAEVYFALTRGQGAFDMEAPVVVAHLTPTIERDVTDETTPLRPITPSGDALAEHAAYLNRLAQQTGRPGAW